MLDATQQPYAAWLQCARTVLYAPLLLRQVSSAVDFGCNCGPWVRALIDQGITDVIGINIGEPGEKLLFPREKYLNHDLSKPLDLKRRFDLGIALEVAEHLPDGENGANNYIDTLTRHCDFILFSAAYPGQGGDGHVNEQPHSYWHQKFLARGYGKLDIIRPLIKDDWRVSWWYQKNAFVYVKPSYAKKFSVYA